MNGEVEAQKRTVDALLEQRRQAAIADSESRAASKKYTKRERGLRVQPTADPF